MPKQKSNRSAVEALRVRPRKRPEWKHKKMNLGHIMTKEERPSVPVSCARAATCRTKKPPPSVC